MRPYLKKKNHTQKKAGRVAHGVGPEFKPHHHKREKERKRKKPLATLIKHHVIKTTTKPE
jgi:hypothetical protein